MATTNALAPIPHPPKKPVVGNMLSLDSAAPVQHLARMVKELGPIFWLDMMGAPLVIVAGHDLVEELSDEKRFDKAVRGALRRVRAVGGDGLFTADTKEPNWSKAHNILMTPFGNRAMQSYHPSMVDIAEQLVKKWERLNGDEEIDVVHDMTALTLDTIGLCGFDYRFNSFYRRDYHPFVESLVRSLETIMMTRGLPLENLWMQKRRRDMAGDVAFMNSMVDEIIAERRKNAGSADEPSAKKDMLAAMMSGVDRATGEQLDDVNIRYQINTFLIAGHETTSGLLSCAIYAMLKHPEVLKKAYEEVDRVFGPDVDARPTYQQVTQLHYITQILKEALRLWPPAPAYGIAPIKDETIGGKYKLKKGTFVTVLVLALHRDPSVWGPNPDAFDPENFSREAEAKRPLNAWKPFGNGQRACIGRGFAMHEAALALGMILQRFKLFDHQRYQMVLKETLTIKPDGFKIKVKPRVDHDRAAFAGRATATTAKAPVAGTRTRPGHNTPLLLLYGSNLGTAEELATRVADLAEVNGFATRLAPLDEYVGKLPEQGGVLIFCASYNGAPPDNAAQFVKWLGGDLPKDALSKVKYAVFGCGNSDWLATYQSIPRLIDEQLAAHGATSVFGRGEGDAREDLDGQFESWFAKMTPVAVKQFGIDGSFARSADDAPLYSIEPVAPSVANTAVGQGGMMPMKVLVNSELQNHSDDNVRSTRHIEVQLPEGTSYRVGDHLSVIPRNDPVLVDAVSRRFGFLPTDQIRLNVAEGRRAQLPVGDVVSVGRLLAEFVELQQVATRKQIQIMSEHTRCPMTKPKLLALVGDDVAAGERYRAEVLLKRKSVFDLLEEHPACELPFHAYLEMLSLLAPRYYSISSSPNGIVVGTPARCSVTTAVVSGAASSGRGLYKGVCSNYLAGRRAGDTVHAIVRETKAGFRLPDDPAVPLIMIGPGTGLAPFRGFLQERAAQKAGGKTLGPAMLFFGCRNPTQDFLYEDELKAFAADGVCELHVAFSRGDGPKTYVQHQITAQQERVWQLIEQGAIIYVCGDGGKMEPDVKAALVGIYRARSGADEAAGLRWIEEMGTSNRYVLDVWAGA